MSLVLRPDPAMFLPTYHRLCLAETHKSIYIINFGAGGSGKSYAQAQFFVKLCIDTKVKEKIMVLRKTGNSLEDSCIDEFISNALPFWGLQEGRDYKYNISRRMITFTKTNAKIIFKGLDNPEKLKSIPGVTRLWIEEATEITAEEFKIVNDRIRGNPRIYLTFNPISEQHWIKKDFLDYYGFILDTSGKTVGLYRKLPKGSISVLFSTFRENPYVGEKYIMRMAYYKKVDPDHYRIYGLGLWGIIRPKMPFFNLWDGNIHLKQGLSYDKKLGSIYLSFDFNVNNSILISQREPGVWVKYLEVMHGTGDLKEMCNQIVNKYGRFQWYYFTGDGSGNNGSATTENNMAAWQLIQAYFLEFGVPGQYCHFGAVPKANSRTHVSRTIVNQLIKYYGPNLTMDKDNCALLVDDINRMRAVPNGSLDKVDCDKHNYGHLGDCFRYDLQNFDGAIIKDLLGDDLYKAVSSPHQHQYNNAA